MNSRWISFLAVVLTLVSSESCRRTSDQDRTDIERVFSTYQQSLNDADVALASQVWLQSPDVLVVTPAGRFKGWESVRQDIYLTMQKQMRERHVEASHVSIVVAGDAAWLVYDFVFTAKLADGRPLAIKGWESHGYLRTRDGWRIAQLHYSIPPPS